MNYRVVHCKGCGKPDYTKTGVCPACRQFNKTKTLESKEKEIETRISNVPYIGWRLLRYEDSILRSLVSGDNPWDEPGIITARCGRDWQYCTAEHMQRCQCGIYSFKSNRERELIFTLFNILPNSVLGEIYIWGAMVKHKDGYRSQFAKIKSLFTKYGQITNYAIKERYNCNVGMILPYCKMDTIVRNRIVRIDERASLEDIRYARIRDIYFEKVDNDLLLHILVL